MIDPFLLRPMLAGLAVALVVGPLGAFIVWRKMAYFGDATAHASILGVAFALAFSFPIGIGTFGIAVVMGALVVYLVSRGYSGDATLGVLSHTALALGLIAVSFLPAARVNLEDLLFGDILTSSWSEVAIMWGAGFVIVAVLIWRWTRLLTATLNVDLAIASGINPTREQMVLTLLLAMLVAMALKIVGALLIAAMLVIPAATARAFARSPETMAIVASAIAAISVFGGLMFSMATDAPAGPSIVATAGIMFAISVAFGARQKP